MRCDITFSSVTNLLTTFSSSFSFFPFFLLSAFPFFLSFIPSFLSAFLFSFHSFFLFFLFSLSLGGRGGKKVHKKRPNTTQIDAQPSGVPQSYIPADQIQSLLEQHGSCPLSVLFKVCILTSYVSCCRSFSNQWRRAPSLQALSHPESKRRHTADVLY